MPRDDRLRLHEDERLPPARPEAGHPNPEQAISGAQRHSTSAALPLEDEELVPQHEQFHVERRPAADDIAQRGLRSGTQIAAGCGSSYVSDPQSRAASTLPVSTTPSAKSDMPRTRARSAPESGSVRRMDARGCQ